MDLPPKLTALAAAQGGVFTAEQALAAGYGRSEIGKLWRSGAWVRLRRGIYAEAEIVPADLEGRHLLALRAVILALSGPAAASHETSALLQGIALLEPDLSLVHVTREGSASSRTTGGVSQHYATLPAGHLTKVKEILTTSAARTVVDLARQCSFVAALVAAESALHLGLATLDELDEVLAYCVDWPGGRNAGRVVAFASPYSESPGETLGRVAFDVLGVPQPDQQVYILDASGLIGRCDYFWEKFHTIGEFDGKLKYTGDRDDDGDDPLVREKKREDRLRDAGLEVCRFDWPESRSCSDSVRRKAFAAFRRAQNNRAKRTYRFKRQPPAR